MTRQEAKQHILQSKGKFLSVEFVKRTDGTKRRMVCRLGVKKHLKGGKLPFQPSQLGLISVWDVQKQEYRFIPLEGLVRIKVQGKWTRIE